MICKKQEIITKKYTYMDLQKISKNNHHLFTLPQEKTLTLLSTLSCARYVMILDGLIIIIKWNVSMELQEQITSNNKKFKSFAKS